MAVDVRHHRQMQNKLIVAMVLAWAGGLGGCPQWAVAGDSRIESALDSSLERPDLHAHFWLSYGLSLTVTEILEGPRPRWGPQVGTYWAAAWATVGVGALGLLKELALDSAVDTDDLVADGLGLAANWMVQVGVDF